MLGVTLTELGRKKARRSRRSIAPIALDPTGAEPHLALARILALDGRDAALRHAEIAARREPGKGYEMQAQVLLDLNPARTSRGGARRSLVRDPQRAMSEFVLGGRGQKAGRYGDALAAVHSGAEANRLRRIRSF